MVLTIEMLAPGLRLLPIQIVPALSGIRTGVTETRQSRVELGVTVQFGPGQIEQPTFALGERFYGFFLTDAQT